jgi:hypothetical protein
MRALGNRPGHHFAHSELAATVQSIPRRGILGDDRSSRHTPDAGTCTESQARAKLDAVVCSQDEQNAHFNVTIAVLLWQIPWLLPMNRVTRTAIKYNT